MSGKTQSEWRRYVRVWHFLTQVDSHLIALVASLMTAGGILSGIAPVFLKEAVDALAEPDGVAKFAIISVVGYGLMMGAARFLGELHAFSFGTLEQRLHRRLRERALGSILRQPYLTLIDQPAGKLSQQIANGTRGATQCLTAGILGLTPILVQLVTVVTVLGAFLDLKYALILVATCIIYALLFYRGIRRVMEPQKRAATALTEMNAALTDTLLHPETTKYLAAERDLTRRMSTMFERVQLASLGVVRARTAWGVSAALVFMIALLATMLVAFGDARSGIISPGAFVLVGAYLIQIVRPLEVVGIAYRDFSQGLMLLDDSIVHLSEVGTEPLRQGEVPLTQTDWAIEFKGVCFSYDRRAPTLSDCSFRIEEGQEVAFVGRSGAGKSTITRLMTRLIEPCAGTILIGSIPVNEIELTSYRQSIGVVPQDTALYDGTISWNLGLGATRPSTSIDGLAEELGTADFIGKLPHAYETVVGPKGVKLSGGERQRIGLTRLAFRSPRIIILDEPTSSMDSLTESEVLARVRKSFPDTTKVIVAHRLSTIKNVSRIFLVADGKIAESGSHDELLKLEGPYAALWKEQNAKEEGAFV